MTSLLRAVFPACLLSLSFHFLAAQNNVQYRLELLPDNQTYRVLMRPTVSWAAPNNNTLGAQVTILARTGTLAVTNLTNVNGNWADVAPVVAPTENPDYDYFVFYLVSSTQLPFTAGTETPLFTFKRAGAPCTTGQLGLINNFVDPFMEPNSQSLNVGNYMATQGGGGSANNLWNGNYSAGSANCQGDCTIEYILTEPISGRYQVSMKSSVNWPAPQNTTSTQQVSVKVPTGGFVVSNLTNLVSGATYVLGSRNDHPAEDPAFDYLHFNLQNQTTALTYQNGVTLPLFTFENTGTCSLGKIWLTDNSTDPFMPPNSQSINTGQQLTTYGYGTPDVPICISGTGSVNCNTASPCPPPAPGSILGPDLTVCAGQAAQLQVSGTYTSFAWSPTTGLSCTNCPNPNATPTATTTYIVSVTNAASCNFRDTIVVNVTPKPTISSVANTQPGCNQSNGSITVSATGTGTLEYSINGGSTWQSSPTFPNLAGGTYNIQARRQGTTCTAIYSENPVVLNSPSSPTILQVFSNNPSDCGLNNGSIFIVATGSNLQYSVNGGTSWTTSFFFNGLPAGSFSIAVRDAVSNCTTLGNAVVLSGPSAPAIVAVSPTAATDCGTATGSLSITATGGQSPLEYSINNGAFWQTSNVFNGLLPGSYVAWVRNASNTCPIAGPAVTIGEPTAPNVTAVAATQPTACGQNNGSIVITAIAGQGPIEYSINGTSWQSSNSFLNLAAGTYTVMVRNQTGGSCPKNFIGNPVVINAPQGPAITAVVKVNPTNCGQTGNGSIQISAFPTTNVEYSINGGTTWQASNEFSNLTAGTYQLQVRVVGGTCLNTYPNVTLVQPVSATISGFSKTDISDCGANDGSITITATGGLGPLEYSINGTFWQTNPVFSPLAAGTYTLRVRNFNGTCVHTHPTPAVINGIAGPSITNVTKTAATCGQNNGTLTVTASGGSGPLEYSLDGANWQTGATFTNVGPGTYNCFVRNSDNTCPNPWVSNPVVMSQPPAPQISQVVSGNVSDCGLSDGFITITAASTPVAGQPLQFSINGGLTWQNNGSFQNLSAGSYPIVVRNASGTSCPVVYPTVTILGKTGPTLLAATATNPTQCGTANGSIQITAFGGQNPLEYSLDGTNWTSTAFFQNLPAGNYLPRVRNADNSCVQTAAQQVSLTAPAALPNFTATGFNPTACGLSNGSIMVNVVGSTSGLQFSLNGWNWQSGTVFVNLPAGSYTVFARKSDGTCVTPMPSNPVVLGAGQGPTIVSTQTQDPQGCGVNDGSISINATGSGLEYSINNGVNFQPSNTFTGLGAGTYQLVVRVVGSACTSTATTVLINPNQATISNTSATPVSNCGASDGSISTTATGGLGPLQFSINGGLSWQSSGIFNGLAAGVYTISVRNANGGCTVTSQPVSVSGPQTPLVSSAVGVSPTVCGVDNGSITITATGGVGPLQYSIDNQASWFGNSVFSNLPPGTYRVWVRNANQSCATAFSGNPIILNQGQNIAITNVAASNPTSCSGAANGSITISASGQNLEFSINGGSNFQNNNIFNNLAAGSYAIVARVIGTSCSATATATLTAPGVPTIASVTPSPATDCATPNGSITISASGQNLEFSINGGSNFQNNNIFNGLAAGSYAVVVRNATSGCTASGGVATIAAPSAPAVVSVQANSPAFCGLNNGSIVIAATGGQAPLEFSLDGGTVWMTSSTFNNLGPGSYQIWVRNGDNSCPSAYAANPVVLGSGQNPAVVAVTATDPLGCGTTNGSISIAATGVNLEYSINGGSSFQNSNTFSGLSGGVYQIVVRQNSQNGCSTTASATLNTPTAPVITNVAPTPASNCGSANGSIAVTTSGGSAPLQFSINGGTTWQASNIFSNLNGGTYTVSVRNANGGCTVSAAPVTVGQPNAPTISAANGTSPSSCGASDGSIAITASGGQGPLQFSLDGVNWTSTAFFQNLNSGTYQVWVRNANGSCPVAFAANPVTLSSGQGPVIQNVLAQNPANCANPLDGSISITATGLNLMYSINNGVNFQNNGNFSGLAAGTYQIVVQQNASNCTATTSVTLLAPTAPVITNVNATAVTDCSTANGSIAVSASGSPGPLQFSINGGVSWQASNIFSNLSDGTYTVSVRNAAGACTATSAPVTVGSPVAPTILAVNPTSPTGCGLNDGSISINASSGQGAWQYSINGGQTWSNSQTFNNLPAGSYQIWVRNANNSCAVAWSGNPFVLNGPTQGPQIQSVLAQNPHGCGAVDGVLTINASGVNLEYSINGGQNFQNNNIFSGLAAGLYNVVVRQTASCTSTATATLSEPAAPLVSLILTTPADCQSPTGGINVVASGGLAPLQFSADGGTTWQNSNVFAGLAPGTYNVRVRNADGGCATPPAPTTVAMIVAPTIASVTPTAPTGCGMNNGSIVIQASAAGSGGQLEYSIDNGLTWHANNIFIGLPAGTYRILVKLLNSTCSTSYASNPVILNAPQGPQIVAVQATDPQGCHPNGTITIAASGSNLEYSLDGGATWQSQNVFSNLSSGAYTVVVRQFGSACTTTASLTLAAPGQQGLVEYFLEKIGQGKYRVSMTALTTWPSPLNLTSSQQIALKVPAGGFAVGNLTNLVAGANYVLGTRADHPTEAPGFDYLHFNLQGPSTTLTYQTGVNVPLFTFENVGSCAGGTIRLVDNATDPFMPPNLQNINTGQQLTTLGYGQPDVPICIGGSGQAECTGAPCPPPADILGANKIACAGGSVQLQASGNFSNFTWTPSAGLSCTNCPNPTVNPTATTKYVVQVSGGNGCIFKDSLLVVVVPKPTILTSQTEDPQGCGVNNGSILVNALGTNLEFSINGGASFQTSNYFSGLASGSYSVVVQAVGAGCTSTATVALIEPMPPSIIGFTTTPAGCNTPTGSITMNVSAPQGGVEYSINGGMSWQPGNTFSGLAAGTYTLEVRNANGGCTQTSAPVSVPNPALPAIVSVQTNNPQGCGASNGSVTIAATGTNLEYSLDAGLNFQNSNVFSNLPAGTYTAAVREKNENCWNTQTVVLVEPAPATIVEVAVLPTDCSGPTGVVSVVAAGGLPPLQYSIDGGATWQLSNLFGNLPAGSYTVKIRNANGGCVVTASLPAVVKQPVQAVIGSVNSVSPTSCTSNNGSITVAATGGQGPLQYSIDNVNWFTSGFFNGLAPGSYQVWVRNTDNSCPVAFSGNPVVLSAPQAPLIASVQAVNPTNCANPTNGSITINAAGVGLEFSINGGATFHNSNVFNGLSAGFYQIVVRVAGSAACFSSSSATLTLPTPPVITAVTPTASACAGASGSVTVTATNTTGVLEFSINNGVSWQASNVFSGLAPGTYTVLVRRTNGFCAVSSAPVTVTSVDTQKPTISCPPNVVLTAPQGQNFLNINNLAAPTVADNCSGAVPFSFVRAGATTGNGLGIANGNYNVGTTTVTYTAVDAAGNTATCAFTITVLQAGAVLPILLKSDTLTTPCDVPWQTVAVPVRVSNFTDVASMRFDVVWDPTVLSLAVPGDFVDVNGFGLSTNAGFYTDTLTGRLHFSGLTANPSGWPDLPAGGTFFVLNFKFKNPSATSTISFENLNATQAGTLVNVPVTPKPGRVQATPDTKPPVLAACPQNVTVAASGTLCQQQVNLVPPTATDNCALGLLTVVSSHPSDIFPVGTTTVTFTATDHKGLTASCSATVTVTSAAAPQFSGCPNNINVNLLTGPCEGSAFWTPPVAFNACGANNFTVTSTHNPGDVFQLGTTQVVYNVTDGQGLTAQCAFNVTVRDLVPPTVQNCPTAPVVLTPQAGNCTLAGLWTAPVFTDNCSPTVQVVSTKNPGDLLPIGPTTVTYTGTDIWGNASTCTFVVLVEDATPPDLKNCPQNVVVAATSVDPILGCGATASWTAPDLIPVCSLTGNTLTSNFSPGAFFPLGTTRVTYFAANPYGVRDSCSFLVTVEDKVPPAFVVFPENQTVTLPAGECKAVLNWAAPVVTEACGLDTVFSNIQPGDALPTGTNVITYTAIDESGNSATRSFTVVVRDATAPKFVSCPPNLTVTAANNSCEAVANWPAATATDDCDQSVKLTATAAAGQKFPAGTTPVTIVATDDSGNADSCQFTVTVLSSGSPSISNCPPNQLLYGCEVVAIWVDPATTGFCVTPSVSADYAPGSLFQTGVTTVTYTASDAQGNTATCSFFITVTEFTPPVMDCPEAVKIDLAGRVISDPDGFISKTDTTFDCTEIGVSFDNLTATDNCSPTVAVVQTAGPTTGSALAEGENLLTFKAEDKVGNTTICQVKIEVVPFDELPAATANVEIGCGGEDVVITADSVAGATYLWTRPDGTTLVGTREQSFKLNTSNSGTYAVRLMLDGCISEADSTTVYLANRPVAMPDTVEINPGESVEIAILENDLNLPPGDAVATLISVVRGVTINSQGIAVYDGDELPGSTVIFVYEVCSKTCPTACSRTKVIIKISDKDCAFIPNVITPNVDEANDAFIIPCLEERGGDELPDNHLIIYNQWGDRVFEAQPYINDAEHAWRGTLFGEDGNYLPDGTYYYVFKPSPKSKTVIKGFVDIYR